MTNAPQHAVLAARDSPGEPVVETITGKAIALSTAVDVVEAQLKDYFSVRERAGREGLHEWELNYLCGRIFLALRDAN
jgi:hypothetical protein